MTIRLTKCPVPAYTMPEEVLLFEPQYADTRKDFKNGDYERAIFTNCELEEKEQILLEDFDQFRKEKKMKFTRSMNARVLRYVAHARGNMNKAMQCLITTQQWRRQQFNPPLEDSNLMWDCLLYTSPSPRDRG